MDKKRTIGWIDNMDGWMDKRYMKKNRWMVGRIKKIDEKIDGWLNGYFFL